MPQPLLANDGNTAVSHCAYGNITLGNGKK